MADEIDEPYYKGGKWWINKDPDDKLYYKADVELQLEGGGTTAASVETIVAGVEVLEPAVVQGNAMVAMLGGLDVSEDDPQNFCTFRVTCANGERFDKTIWFKRKDK